MGICAEFVQNFTLESIVHDVFRVRVLIDHARQEGLQVCPARCDLDLRGIFERLPDV